MEVQFARIEGTSKPFYLTVTVLASLVLAGVYSTYLMHAHGLYLSGMTNRVPWGLQIAMAIYYIGLSAGSLVVSGLYGIFGKMEYKPFARIAAYLAMLFLIAGLLSIFTDQGRIERSTPGCTWATSRSASSTSGRCSRRRVRSRRSRP
jgi:molybdopterin-containing oxidoreductase family membrane subunit